MDRVRIEVLDANLGGFTRALSHWGLGIRDLLENDLMIPAMEEIPKRVDGNV